MCTFKKNNSEFKMYLQLNTHIPYEPTHHTHTYTHTHTCGVTEVIKAFKTAIIFNRLFYFLLVTSHH